MKSYSVFINSDTIDKAKELFKINDEVGVAALHSLVLAGFKNGIGRGIVIGGTAVVLVGCVSMVAKKIVSLIKKHNERKQSQKEES